jgi:hypothetical protein
MVRVTVHTDEHVDHEPNTFADAVAEAREVLAVGERA